MESKKYEAWEEQMYWENFNFCHFVVVLSNHFRNGLILPKKFTDCMRTHLPDKAVLKVNTITWNVKLEKDKDDVMLQGDEWKQFTKAYSLNKLDMLLFKYNRHECFEVLLFDQANLCEKEASYFVRKGQQPKTVNCDDSKGKATDNLVKEITDRNQEGFRGSAYNLRGRRNNKDCYNEEEHDEGSDSQENDTTPKGADCTRFMEVPFNYSKRNYKTAQKTTHKRKKTVVIHCYKSNRRRVTEAEKEKAMEKAKEALALCCDSFIAVMRPSSVYKRFYMTIPNHWKHESFYKGQEVILKVKDKTWVCTLEFDKYRGFQRGWKRFALENFLEEFDVCLFVPTASINGRAALDVSIFRVVPEPVHLSPVTPCLAEDLDYPQRKRCRKYSGPFSKGLYSGRGANKTELSGRSTSSREIRACGKSSARQITEAQKIQVLNKAKETQDEHENSFTAIMRPCCVDKRFFMTIPKDWKPRSLMKKGQEVVLKVKEKTWVCIFCLSPSNVGLQTGWKRFALDNELEEFDACVFVPAEWKNGRLVFDVSIFRVRLEV
ncbi:unnamed protein product [Amaranthus hypochondriacus]